MAYSVVIPQVPRKTRTPFYFSRRVEADASPTHCTQWRNEESKPIVGVGGDAASTKVHFQRSGVSTLTSKDLRRRKGKMRRTFWLLMATLLALLLLAGTASAQDRENWYKWSQPPYQIGEYQGMPLYLGWDHGSCKPWQVITLAEKNVQRHFFRLSIIIMKP